MSELRRGFAFATVTGCTKAFRCAPLSVNNFAFVWFWRRRTEAGGVEPPSEKPCNTKTTCLSRSVCFTGGTQSGQDAPPASPIISPLHYGPKRNGQPTV